MANEPTDECNGVVRGKWRRAEIIACASFCFVLFGWIWQNYYDVNNRMIIAEQRIEKNAQDIKNLGNVNEALATLTERTEATREDVKDIKRIVMELMKKSK